jgi:hypothetical protein
MVGVGNGFSALSGVPETPAADLFDKLRASAGGLFSAYVPNMKMADNPG